MPATYSTWEYYSGVWRGTQGETEYARLALWAAGEINSRTFCRSLSAPASMAGALRDCECELVDAMAAHKAADSLLPTGISSINNDGLSVSAGPADRKAAQSAEVQDICRKHLLRPVNLLYAGVKRC